ncbi:hypothetical protein [Hyphomicrobium sp. 2TAF46]|uniref:hypothetical protein n=1 Tax=Hyphomicrobium sp. 2TAF46 TaxID=3233019 RepID=UPI003F915207
MQFRLRYSGPLRHADINSLDGKQALRRKFHPQLKDHWDNISLIDTGVPKYQNSRDPQNKKLGLIEKLGNFDFLPLVSDAYAWNTIAELDILFLRPETPGSVVKFKGDLDNRIKALIDGLRKPDNAHELPKEDEPREGEHPFFCLLQDDRLITRLSVTADRLLAAPSPYDVEIMITVTVRARAKYVNNAVVW